VNFYKRLLKIKALLFTMFGAIFGKCLCDIYIGNICIQK